MKNQVSKEIKDKAERLESLRNETMKLEEDIARLINIEILKGKDKS